MILQREETMTDHLRACILLQDKRDEIYFPPFPLPENQTYFPNYKLRNSRLLTQPRKGPEPVFHSSVLHSKLTQTFGSFYEVRYNSK